MKDDSENDLLIGILAILGFMVFSVMSKNSAASGSASGSATVGPLGPTLNSDGTVFNPATSSNPVIANADQNFGVDPLGW